MKPRLSPSRSTRPALVLLAALAGANLSFAQTWNAAGNGTWSTAGNWNPATVPGTGNTATLNDTSSNRTVTYDSGASGTVGTLSINQTTANITNTVDLQRNLTLQNALTLGASAGTEQVIVGSTASTGFQLTSSNGVALNSGGVLALSATTNTLGNGFQAGSTSANTAITIAGGTLLVQATTGNFTTGAASNTVNGSLSMTDGIIRFDNVAGTASDRRLDIRGNVNISGGAITADRSTALLQFLSSANTTITLNPTTFESTKIGLNFQSNFTQGISSNQTLGAIAFRGTGVKTLTSTASGNGIGALTFWDTDSATPSSAATLQLGSNLTLNSAANQPTVTISGGHTPESGRIDAAINTNGFTLDLTAGATAGVWTPAASTQTTPTAVTNTVWNLSGNGSVRANAFNFSTANVTTNVGAGTVLNAAGGNATASNLGSTGTINSASTFRYSGSADAANPATLTFARDIGQVAVTSGALRVLSGATGVITGIAVSGGTLDLNNTPRSFGTLSLTGGTLANGNYSLTSGNFTGLQTGTVSGQLSGTSSLIKDSPGVLTLAGNNNFGTGGGSVTVNQGTLLAGHVNAFGATALVIANGGAIDLGGLSINKWFNIGANGGSISNGTIARNTSNNATFAWQAGSVSASITEAGGGIVSISKTGNGTLTIAGNNAHSGTTTVANGILEVTANNALGTTAAGTTVSSGAALKLTGVNYATAEALSINGTGVSGGGALVNSGTSTYAGAVTAASNATINTGGGTITFTGGLVKDGTVLVLTGGGTVNVNTTAISGSSANSDLIINGTTANLNVANTYNGPTTIRNGGTINANVTNALPTANGRSALIMDDSGTGSSSLALANAGQSIASLTGASSSTVNLNGNTLTIGATSGSTTFAGVISGTDGSLIKDGASTQILTGGNTYTGTTTITAGTLQLGAGNVLADSSNIVLNGGTLAGGAGFSDTVGTLSLLANSSIDLGSGSSLMFADSSALNWSSFGLSISGSFLSESSIRFGTDSNGLTSGQLAQITIIGNSAPISLDSLGYLTTAIPEPSTFAALAGLGALGVVAARRRRRA